MPISFHHVDELAAPPSNLICIDKKSVSLRLYKRSSHRFASMSHVAYRLPAVGAISSPNSLRSSICTRMTRVHQECFRSIGVHGRTSLTTMFNNGKIVRCCCAQPRHARICVKPFVLGPREGFVDADPKTARRNKR